MVARHRGQTKSELYIKEIFSEFTITIRRQTFSDDNHNCRFWTIENKSVLILGQEKGEDLNSRMERNFGMMKPEVIGNVSG